MATLRDFAPEYASGDKALHGAVHPVRGKVAKWEQHEVDIWWAAATGRKRPGFSALWFKHRDLPYAKVHQGAVQGAESEVDI